MVMVMVMEMVMVMVMAMVMVLVMVLVMVMVMVVVILRLTFGRPARRENRRRSLRVLSACVLRAPPVQKRGGAPDAARARALKLDPTLHFVPILRTTDTQNASLPRARAIEPAPALR